MRDWPRETLRLTESTSSGVREIDRSLGSAGERMGERMGESSLAPRLGTPSPGSVRRKLRCKLRYL